MQSNWKRWGAEDERGAANLLTSPHVLRACGTPREGRVFDLGIEVKKGGPVVGGRMSPLHLMSVDGGDYSALGREDDGSADDYLFMAVHGSTHVDALSHVWAEGAMYNGFSYKEVRSSGAARCGMEKAGGMVTVGHVFDFRNASGLQNNRISSADFEAQERASGLEIRPGDAVLVCTGWMETHAAGGDADSTPTVSPEAADWFADRDVALVGADNPAVEDLSVVPLRLHHALLRDRGVYLLELLSLQGAADTGVSSGLLVVAPLRISRGVGSPVNPLLIV